MFKLKCDDFLDYDEATGTYSMSAEQQVRDETEKNKWKSTGFTLLKDWRLYLMLVPLLLVYLLWRYLPMTNLLTAFKYADTGGATNANEYDWYGLTNFKDLFFSSTSYQFWQAFRNTFIIAFYGLLFGFPFPIILALFFNEVKSNITRSILQVCVYLPKFMSTVIITSLAIVLFRGPTKDGTTEGVGVITQFLLAITPKDGPLHNVVTSVQGRYGLVFTPRYFRAIYQITGIWEHGGYDSIVFFGAVIAISPTSYEAAQIDGAGKMAQMRYVVLPGILSTVVIMLIMKVGSLLSVGYEKVYLMEKSTNYEAADIVATLANRWSDPNVSGGGGNEVLGIAAEMVNNLIGMILVLGANAVAKRASDVSLY